MLLKDYNPYKLNSKDTRIENLNESLLSYLDTLPSNIRNQIVITSGNDSDHTSNSRHDSNNAVDMRYTDAAYNYMEKDPTRIKKQITLLNPNHGTGKHIHLSHGKGTENKNDVWMDPHSDGAKKISGQLGNAERRVYNFFMDKGLSPQAAAALTGNFSVESNFNTRIKGDENLKTPSVGLAQWREGRLDRLKKKEDYYSLDTQLNFVWEELNSTHKVALEQLNSAQTPEDAAIAVRRHYEGATESNDDRRISETKRFMGQNSTQENNPNRKEYYNQEYTGNEIGDQSKVDLEPLTEEGIRAILEEQRKNQEESFMAAIQSLKPKQEEEQFQKAPQQAAQQPQYQEQEQGPDPLYDYIDIETYAKGGKVRGEKVTCKKCKWEWSTSDSAEYDKYVCHKCGKDNEVTKLEEGGKFNDELSSDPPSN
jgi:hypothetical protein